MSPEISATIGIDVETASNERLAKRVFDFCGEMAECYPEDALEYSAFQALQVAMLKLNGGLFRDAD